MRKFIFILMAAFCSIVTVSAQSQSNYSGSSKFFDNTSVGIVGGVETNLHDWNAPQGAIAGIVLNKEITPIFGVTLEGNTNINSLRNWASKASHFHCANTFDGLSVYLTPRVNLTNAILDYKGNPRKFEVEALAGPGYGFFLHDEYNALLVKAGLNFNYNVSKAFTVTLRPAVVYNLHATAAQFDSRNAVAQLTAGVVYHFKTSNRTHSFNKARLYNQSEIDALNAKITNLQSDLNDARNAAKTVVNTVDTVYIESPSSMGNVVSFKLNSAEVDETQMANLDNAVRMLKENPDLKVTLKGYADKNTGSAVYNKRLSVRRAEAVKNVIVNKYGISADRIDTLGVGDTEQLYEDNNWNRVVIFVENK